MIEEGSLPQAVVPLVAFPQLLRRHGFAVAPEQTTSFLTATELLGPRRIEDVRHAARATLAPSPEQHDLFEALFRAHFYGEVGEGEAPAETQQDEEPVEAFEGAGGSFDPPEVAEVQESGQASATAELLTARQFAELGEDMTLRRFRRSLPARLPRRRGFRLGPAKRGRTLDMPRTLRAAMRHGGDIAELRHLRRRTRQRNVLLLVDVSGSMKSQTEQLMRFSHALTHAATRVEVFTFGTRLTRITRALRLKNRESALATAAATVADWDGGTRIGEALQAFLSVPRFAAYARGAITLILSDGLERGESTLMTDAVARLARRSWHIGWLTPLAADPEFEPETAALRSILPLIDDLSDGASVEAVCGYLLSLGEVAPGRRTSSKR